MIADCGFGIAKIRSRRRRGPAPLRVPHSAIHLPQSSRSGISLMEVLISIFVMLFGLMGVAAIFPVGNHYVVEGEKHDIGQLLAQNAFEEMQARGMLRPNLWLYADHPDPNTPGTPFINALTRQFQLAIGIGSGHAFVIDPLGGGETSVPPLERTYFPWNAQTLAPMNPWQGLPPGGISGSGWPVRRMTLPQAGSRPLNNAVSETIFRLRDDLAVEMPERDDVPSIQRWSVDSTGQLLSRQYQGNYSWLATIVPPSEPAHEGMQPALRQTYPYEVSVAVFYKRVLTPSADSERLLEAEMLPGGELVMYGASVDEVDKSLENIKPGSWVAVMGVNETTGAFMVKWYRLLALDEETNTQAVAGNLLSSSNRSLVLRRAMIHGPDWHFREGGPGFVGNLRVAILPGIASVVTREMVLEQDSLWSSN